MPKKDSVNRRPWGRWEILSETPTHKVKRITVLPSQRLSYQRHERRSEHWFVVEGEALVTLEGRPHTLRVGEGVDIPMRCAHRIANEGRSELVFIEVALGDYFEEDDITRLEDDYGRA